MPCKRKAEKADGGAADSPAAAEMTAAETPATSINMHYLREPTAVHLILIGQTYIEQSEVSTADALTKGRGAVRGPVEKPKDPSLDALPTFCSPDGMDMRQFVELMVGAMRMGFVYTDGKKESLPDLVTQEQPFALEFYPPTIENFFDTTNMGIISADLNEETDRFVDLLQTTMQHWTPDPEQLKRFLAKENQHKSFLFEMRWTDKENRRERIAKYVRSFGGNDTLQTDEAKKAKVNQLCEQMDYLLGLMAGRKFPKYSWVMLTQEQFKVLAAEKRLFAGMIRDIGHREFFVFNSPKVEVDEEDETKRYVNPERLGALLAPGDQARTAAELAQKDSTNDDAPADEWTANTWQLRDVAEEVVINYQSDPNSPDGVNALANILTKQQIKEGTTQVKVKCADPADVGKMPMFPLLKVTTEDGREVHRTSVLHFSFMITDSTVIRTEQRDTHVKCFACEKELYLFGPVRVTGCGHTGMCGQCQAEWNGTCPECRDPVKCDTFVIFTVDGKPWSGHQDAAASKGKQPVPSACIDLTMSSDDEDIAGNGD